MRLVEDIKTTDNDEGACINEGSLMDKETGQGLPPEDRGITDPVLGGLDMVDTNHALLTCDFAGPSHSKCK